MMSEKEQTKNTSETHTNNNIDHEEKYKKR